MLSNDLTSSQSLRYRSVIATIRWGHLALLLAGLVLAVTIRYGTFSGWGTDQSGYIEAGRRWNTGELAAPVPLALWPALADRAPAASPLAFRPGIRSGTDVSWYALGYPVIMAAASSLSHEFGAYLAAPAMAGLMVWCVYSIASQAGGSRVGLIAALLIATSPVTLGYGMMPMSDVPAASLWVLAWAVSFGRGYGAAMAAGISAGLAMMVRPHLAPLAVVPLLLVICGGRFEWRFRTGSWKRAVVYAAATSPGPLIVAWSQAVLYGDWRTPGYPAWETFFSLSYVPQNAWLLVKHLIALHTPLVFLGLAGSVHLFRKTSADGVRLVVLSALLIAVINYLLFLPYLPYDDVFFVRFMLPSLAALCVLNSVVLAEFARWLSSVRRVLVGIAAVPVVVILWFQIPLVRYTLTIHQDHSRIRVMGRYLREVLPPNAVVFCALQSAGVSHYTGAQVLRFDLIPPGTLDSFVDALKGRGYEPVLVMDEIYDQQPFRAHAVAGLSKYRWMPRAEFRSTSAVHFMVPIPRGQLDKHREHIDKLK